MSDCRRVDLLGEVRRGSSPDCRVLRRVLLRGLHVQPLADHQPDESLGRTGPWEVMYACHKVLDCQQELMHAVCMLKTWLGLQ